MANPIGSGGGNWGYSPSSDDDFGDENMFGKASSSDAKDKASDAKDKASDVNAVEGSTEVHSGSTEVHSGSTEVHSGSTEVHSGNTEVKVGQEAKTESVAPEKFSKEKVQDVFERVTGDVRTPITETQSLAEGLQEYDYRGTTLDECKVYQEHLAKGIEKHQIDLGEISPKWKEQHADIQEKHVVIVGNKIIHIDPADPAFHSHYAKREFGLKIKEGGFHFHHPELFAKAKAKGMTYVALDKTEQPVNPDHVHKLEDDARIEEAHKSFQEFLVTDTKYKKLSYNLGQLQTQMTSLRSRMDTLQSKVDSTNSTEEETRKLTRQSLLKFKIEAEPLPKKIADKIDPIEKENQKQQIYLAPIFQKLNAILTAMRKSGEKEAEKEEEEKHDRDVRHIKQDDLKADKNNADIRQDQVDAERMRKENLKEDTSP